MAGKKCKSLDTYIEASTRLQRIISHRCSLMESTAHSMPAFGVTNITNIGTLVVL